MSSPLAIRFEHVSKQYPRECVTARGLKNLVLHFPKWYQHLRSRAALCALVDVSFDVKHGECLSVIGRNGAGKSTTLGLVAGVIKPTSGRVSTRGRVCPLLELGAGFHHDLSGRENILLNGVLLGLTRAEVRDRMPDIIAFSELAEFIDAPLRTYSSGMIARLGFSVAVHLDPQILLVDEALAVGDEAFQAKCLRRMQQFRDSGTTMLFVSHDMHSVAKISDRVALIEHGQLVDIGDPTRVIGRYQGRAAA